MFTSHVDVLEILASDELFLESSWKIIQDYDVSLNRKNVSFYDKLIEKELYFFSQLISLKESSDIVLKIMNKNSDEFKKFFQLFNDYTKNNKI